MPYKFPPDIDERVKAQIASGQFVTEDDVLREAISTLESRQRGLKAIQDMVRVADDEIAAGKVGPFNAEQTKQAVRQRLEEHGINN